jgi:hypothetical protein
LISLFWFGSMKWFCHWRYHYSLIPWHLPLKPSQDQSREKQQTFQEWNTWHLWQEKQWRMCHKYALFSRPMCGNYNFSSLHSPIGLRAFTLCIFGIFLLLLALWSPGLSIKCIIKWWYLCK